jgi:hypothetical protein
MAFYIGSKNDIPLYLNAKRRYMLIKFLFVCLSRSRQVSLIKKRGIMLGTRKKAGREVYTYMFRSLFIEILYRNDNPEEPVENFIMIPGFRKLNDHFEKEIKAAK